MHQVPFGSPIPPNTPHAILVSVPKWHEAVARHDKTVDRMLVNGYPRFFVQLTIAKLASICQQQYAAENERCMLFPTQKTANYCREFIQKRLSQSDTVASARLVQLLICPDENSKTDSSSPDICVDFHILVFPTDACRLANEFWQHTGLGMTSRLAEKCLSLLSDGSSLSSGASNPSNRYAESHNRHYSTKSPEPPASRPTILPSSDEELNEERLPVTAGSLAKRVLRSRIAQGLVANRARARAPSVSAGDVYLYPCGMAAIWNAHRLLFDVRPPAKSVSFGFPYMDTLKVLQKWGLGCHFLGHGLDSDIDSLERFLVEELEHNPEKPPLLALFTEHPSNPLLRSVDIPRLRALADKYDFPIVVDDTIGNYINVDVLPYADIVVSSLTKFFSGASNVMGGSLVLNPEGRHYEALKGYLNQNFEDTYFDEDAICMEENSRGFKHRIRVTGTNAEAVCDFFRTRSIASGSPTAVIKEVFYPKYTTRDKYDVCRKMYGDPEDGGVGGFGGLISLTFTSMAASEAFFDNLQCVKSASFGTNFTLACPYSIVTHFKELDWASQYGVETGLVRISIGMEERETIISWMKAALDAAEVDHMIRSKIMYKY